MKHDYRDIEHRAVISLMRLRNGTYLVTDVSVGAEHRGNGHASALMEHVVADADAENVVLVLTVGSDGTGLDNQALIAFYGRYGFVQEPRHWSAMRRLPVPAARKVCL